MFELALKMAWLNLLRRLRRSLLVLVMIAASMTAMLSIEGLYDGMTANMILSTIRSDCGEVSIYARGFRLYQRLEYVMKDTSELQAALSAMPEIKSFVRRVALTGLISTARKSSMVRLVGIDAQAEEQFGRFSAFIRQGEMDWGPGIKGCILGNRLADDLHVEVGDRVIFSSQNVQGDISAVSLRVRGVIQTSNPAIDKRTLFAALPKVLKFAGLGPNAATQVAARLREGTDPEQVAAGLQARFPKLEVSTWQQLYPVLKQMQDMMRIFNGISFALVMLVVLMGIFGVMLVSLLERTREFGIMKALGVPYAFIRTQVISEAVILGLSGFAAGAVLSCFSLLYLSSSGLDLSAYAAGLESFGLNAVIFASLKGEYFVRTFLAIMAASLVSVVMPLSRLRRLDPVQILQEE